MNGTTRMRHMARRPLALGLAASLLAAGASAPLAAPSSTDVIWLKVEVNDKGGEHTKVRINVPLSLIEIVVDTIDKREFMARLERQHPPLDIPKLWREIRRMKADDFVTVDTDKEHLRVWKDDEFFRINIREQGYGEPNVEVRIPLVIMDYVFESRDEEISFQDLVERLRGDLPLTLVQARHEDELIKVWLEEE